MLSVENGICSICAVGLELIISFPLSCQLHRDSTEELMELSEDERNELMKKESSRLLKTGHKVSYSPRKEKALKIYLDGGPAKDPGQDWGAGNPFWSRGSSSCCSIASGLWLSLLEVSDLVVTWTSSVTVRCDVNLGLLSEPTDWFRILIVHYSVSLKGSTNAIQYR